MTRTGRVLSGLLSKSCCDQQRASGSPAWNQHSWGATGTGTRSQRLPTPLRVADPTEGRCCSVGVAWHRTDMPASPQKAGAGPCSIRPAATEDWPQRPASGPALLGSPLAPRTDTHLRMAQLSSLSAALPRLRKEGPEFQNTLVVTEFFFKSGFNSFTIGNSQI